MTERAARNGIARHAVRLGVVGARGFEPTIPTCRIVVPSWVAETLAQVA
jgi:hypothetical protein